MTRNSIHRLHCLADNFGKAETKRQLTHAVTDQASRRCSQHPGSHHKLLPVCMRVNVIMMHNETMYSHSYEQRCKVLYCQNLRASLMPMHMRGTLTKGHVCHAAGPVPASLVPKPPLRLEGLCLLPISLITLNGPQVDIHWCAFGKIVISQLHHCHMLCCELLSSLQSVCLADSLNGLPTVIHLTDAAGNKV